MDPEYSPLPSTVVLPDLEEAARLENPRLLRQGPRSRVWRCRVAGSERTVILKQFTDNLRGFTDWASLQFLSAVALPTPVVPRFLAGDVEQRLFVMQDLGSGEDLDAVLHGNSPEPACAALRGLAVTYSRLHAATRSLEPGYFTFRTSLPDADSGRAGEAERWLKSLEKVKGWLQALHLPAPAGLSEELDWIAGRYAEPGEWLAFTHGDPAPSNNHFLDGAARLLDFEYGGFRHALYDLTAWCILCPMPDAELAEMRGAYAGEWARRTGSVHDPIVEQEAWAVMCAYRALALLTWISPDVLNGDRPWAVGWSAREAITTAVGRLASIAASQPRLGGLAEAASAMHAAFRERWGHDLPLPQWPALAQDQHRPL